jgi:hypothetical protein
MGGGSARHPKGDQRGRHDEHQPRCPPLLMQDQRHWPRHQVLRKDSLDLTAEDRMKSVNRYSACPTN